MTSYQYGRSLVSITDEDEAAAKFEGGPKAMCLFGFVPRDEIQATEAHLEAEKVCFVYKEEVKQIPRSNFLSSLESFGIRIIPLSWFRIEIFLSRRSGKIRSFSTSLEVFHGGCEKKYLAAHRRTEKVRKLNFFIYFLNIFWRLECVGISFAYVAHFIC